MDDLAIDQIPVKAVSHLTPYLQKVKKYLNSQLYIPNNGTKY